MLVDEYKFDIFTPTYEVKLHYAVMDISYVYNYEDGHVINMRITPSSWDCINIVSYLCALRGFAAFLRNILEGDTEDDFKTVDDDCINVVTKMKFFIYGLLRMRMKILGCLKRYII